VLWSTSASPVHSPLLPRMTQCTNVPVYQCTSVPVCNCRFSTQRRGLPQARSQSAECTDPTTVTLFKVGLTRPATHGPRQPKHYLGSRAAKVPCHHHSTSPLAETPLACLCMQFFAYSDSMTLRCWYGKYCNRCNMPTFIHQLMHESGPRF